MELCGPFQEGLLSLSPAAQPVLTRICGAGTQGRACKMGGDLNIAEPNQTRSSVIPSVVASAAGVDSSHRETVSKGRGMPQIET